MSRSEHHALKRSSTPQHVPLRTEQVSPPNKANRPIKSAPARIRTWAHGLGKVPGDFGIDSATHAWHECAFDRLRAVPMVVMTSGPVDAASRRESDLQEHQRTSSTEHWARRATLVDSDPRSPSNRPSPWVPMHKTSASWLSAAANTDLAAFSPSSPMTV
jgi:hypothetical protein